MNINATYKGLITGAVMILVSFAIYYYKGSFENNLQYITYFTYIAGIVWTLVAHNLSATEYRSFKNFFSQGFKCFIVVTFMMVAFTWIFLKLNPGLKEEMATGYRADLVKAGNYTSNEIDGMVVKARQYFVTMLTSIAIFGYLVIGSLVTLIASAFLSQRRTKQTNSQL